LLRARGARGRRDSLFGRAPTRASRSSEETTEIDTEKKRNERERAKTPTRTQKQEKEKGVSASRTRHQKQELKAGPKLDENTDTVTKTQHSCGHPFSGSAGLFIFLSSLGF